MTSANSASSRVPPQRSASSRVPPQRSASSRVYVGTFNVAEGTVIVDLILRLHGLLGLTSDYLLTITHRGEIENVAGPVPHELLGDDLNGAIIAAAAFAIGQMRFRGFVGEVNYIHEGAFPRGMLEDVLASDNRAHLSVAACVGNLETVH